MFMYFLYMCITVCRFGVIKNNNNNNNNNNVRLSSKSPNIMVWMISVSSS